MYLHETVSLLHGDLKPANILIKNGTYKLCDFGTCLRLDENMQCVDSSQFIGTEPYMPPENKEDGLDTTYSPGQLALTDKVDIWQIGKVHINLPPEKKNECHDASLAPYFWAKVIKKATDVIDLFFCQSEGH